MVVAVVVVVVEVEVGLSGNVSDGKGRPPRPGRAAEGLVVRPGSGWQSGRPVARPSDR